MAVRRCIQMSSKTTTTSELNDTLTGLLGKCYQGTWPINHLPPPPTSSRSDAFCFILNTEDCNQAGVHWLAVCFPPTYQKKEALFIDSLAFPHTLTNPVLRDYFKGCMVKSAPFAIQSWQSSACGYFCAYILTLLETYLYDLHYLYECQFCPSDLRANEKRVEDWWNRI